MVHVASWNEAAPRERFIHDKYLFNELSLFSFLIIYIENNLLVRIFSLDLSVLELNLRPNRV